MANVALWGAYSQKNFGDDLMAVVFGQAILAAGHEVKILDLDNIETKTYGLNSSVTHQHLFDGADAVVLGGGAVLKSAQYLRAILSPSARKIEHSYYKLGKEVHKRNIPLFPISVGSDGIRSASEVSVFRQSVLKNFNCSMATVRLPHDVSLLRSFGIEAVYYPDILLATSHLFPRPSRINADKPKNIFLNLHKKKAKSGKIIISALRRHFPDAQIFVGSSHLPTASLDYEWMPDRQESVIPRLYEGTVEFLDFLSAMDLVISAKLHLGLCAATYGAAFISLGGRGKVLAQLENMGLQHAYIPGDITDCTEIDELLESFSILQRQYHDQIMNQQVDALGHLKTLSEWLNKLC